MIKHKLCSKRFQCQTQCHYFGNGLYRKSVLCISGLKLIAVYCVKADPQFILICLGKLRNIRCDTSIPDHTFSDTDGIFQYSRNFF